MMVVVVLGVAVARNTRHRCGAVMDKHPQLTSANTELPETLWKTFDQQLLQRGTLYCWWSSYCSSLFF
jgi:hypothetical protein